ncbi:MAG: DUF87 domain-containing protein [bacterium]|nr:DUF87 domain-containing protein [bacterium]
MKSLEKRLKYKKTKEEKIIEKTKNKLKKKPKKLITKQRLNKRIKSSTSFLNTDEVRDDGTIYLKSTEVAKLFSVQAIDLSLNSNEQKVSFFEQLKYLYQIKDLDLRIYKLDDKINLNANKDYLLEKIEQYQNDPVKLEFLQERYSLLETLENDEFTVTSGYYFVIVAKNEKVLEHQINEVKNCCSSIVPKLVIDDIVNRLEIYKFLVNLYFSDSTLDQLLWTDLTELLAPLSISEKNNYIKFEDKEVQLLSIKNVPPFIDELFFEQIFNIPNTKTCIHIKDTINTEDLVRVLDSSYQFLLSDRNTTKKLSNATELDTQKDNFQYLMNQIKNGDEKIKEVNFIIAVSGTKTQREELIKEIKKLADIYRIKIDVARLRQYEAWQSFDISSTSLKDYSIYLPTLTLSAGFPLTTTDFNDEKGIMMGLDIHTALPVFFDMFYLDSSRTSHNMAVISSTGGGKSYTLKKIITNAINTGGVKCFIFDAEAEYKKLVESNNGEYIDLYSKSGGIINPLQVRFLPSENDETEKDDILNCPLPKHLGFLEAFFKCAFEEISEKELVVLLEEVEGLYKKFGIDKNTTISRIEKYSAKDFPTFTDLKQHIETRKNKIKSKEKLIVLEQVELLLNRFLVGTDKFLFDGYTNFDLNKSDLIAFNLQELLYSGNQRIINTQVLNVLTFLNNAIVGNKIKNDSVKNSNEKKHIMVVVDEFHLFIDEENPELLRNFGQMARRLRKYSSSFVCATQSIRDFIGSANILRNATAIFNNCQYQCIGMLKEDDLTAFMELFKQNPLTDTQKAFLLSAKQGEFLLNINNKKRVRLWVRATEKERELMGENK